jgi:N-acetylglucosaminyldiphosphoundecaprenol N-acetyl-beta-D-mannosaminyltransferase
MMLANYSPVEKLSVMGLPVHHSHDYVGCLLARMGQGAHVVTLNAEMCMQAEDHPELARLIQQADLVIPDGAGIELYFRWLQGRRVKRSPGIEVAAALLVQAPPNTTVAFYGGAPGVAQTAARYWQQRLPHLNLVSVQHGFLSDSEQVAFQSKLQELQPDLIFVGLGVPRQEFWIAAHRHLCPEAIWVGVGGSFDIWAGVKSRAPAWLRDNHLEWLYRLYQEPWRWQRMLALPKFVWRALVYR